MPLLSMTGIVKRFGATVALDRVDFSLESGEIHALLGENGAGKTTLMNVLYGLYRPDSGRVLLDGREIRVQAPRDALAVGIGMVHQHFQLVPTFTVAQNVTLGTWGRMEWMFDRRVAEEHARATCERAGLTLDPKAIVGDLPVGVQQRVEIVKVLYRGVKILILDEPTAVLTPQETEELFKALKHLVERGTSIVFISHKLQEVMSISNRATVLRGGKVVGTVEAGKMDGQILARMMVGREIGSSAPSLRDTSSSVNSLSLRQAESPAISPRVTLEVKEIETVSQHGRPGLQKISCLVHSGEILGIAGVDGNGQTELADVLIGMLPITSGRILLDRMDVTGFSLKERLKRGVAFIPQDRHAVGLIPGLTIAENLILHDHNRPPYSYRGFLSLSSVRSSAERLAEAYDIRMAGVDALIETLSGGNQQKVVVARELSRNLHLLIALNPTRGVDIGATEEIHMRLRELRRSGTAVVLISTELDEILALSDWIGVLYNGALMGIVPSETPREEIGLMMAGIRKMKNER